MLLSEYNAGAKRSYTTRAKEEQRKAQEEKVEGGLENPEDLPDIDEKNFRYPGPTPQTRESGIVSLADAVESASRSLRKPTPGKIRALVDEIVFNRIRDGQLDNCGLTVSDLRKTRDSFSKTLRSMRHSRIDYPKREKETGEEGEDPPTAGGKARNVVPVEEVEKHRRKAAGEP